MLYLEGSEKCGTPIEAIQQLTPIINIVIFIIEKHGPFHTHTLTHMCLSKRLLYLTELPNKELDQTITTTG